MKDTNTAIAEVKTYLLALQKKICLALEKFESQARFKDDLWERAGGGGGLTRVLEKGATFEKAGVNFSHIFGNELPPSASAHRKELAGCTFQALGVSLVLHPYNPLAPTTHMNVRFFIAEKPGQAPIWWFGGGFDLTPYYGFAEDCKHWHAIAKAACDQFNPDYYSTFKDWCDRYFYLKHRQEPRGIGGIFFDDFHEIDFAHSFAFMQAIGNAFLPAYLPILEKRYQKNYTEQQRQFQLYRRGRYVEFNLIYDRGTLFGLQSGGRSESILMSLPPAVEWIYNWQPTPGSPEAELYSEFLVAKDWI